MNTKFSKITKRAVGTGIAAAALLALPLAVSQVTGNSFPLLSGNAYAEQGQGAGQGQGGPGHGRDQQGGGSEMGGGGGGAAGGGGAGQVPSAAAGGQGQGGGREPGGTGGTGSAGGGSSAILGRLSMARAYLSPNFDPSKIDDPEAPLANIDAYKTAVELGDTNLDTLAGFLAKVATAPITGASILKVNDMLGITDAFTATGVDAEALAEQVNTLVKESRDEGEE